MIEFIENGIRELSEVLERSEITKYCFYKKARERSQSWFHPNKLFAGDLSTSLTVPYEVRETMKPLLQKYGYEILEEIAQEYLNRNPVIQSLR